MSTEYLVGTWTTNQPIEKDKTYMVELWGTKPFSQSFGFYVGNILIGYFVPKNTGGNHYTMAFTWIREEVLSEIKLYQFAPGSAGQVELTDFRMIELDQQDNLFPYTNYPIDTEGYNVIASEISKNWQLGKRYYIRLKGTKPSTQNFSIYVDRGTTNKGAMSNINGTDIYEHTFSVNQWDISRNISNILSIYQTPNGSTGRCVVDEIVLLELNDTILPKEIIMPSIQITGKVGEVVTVPISINPANAENIDLTALNWNSAIATRTSTSVQYGLVFTGVGIGTFTTTIRCSGDPSVDLQVIINITE